MTEKSSELAYIDGGEVDPIEDLEVLFDGAVGSYGGGEAVVSLFQRPIELPLSLSLSLSSSSSQSPPPYSSSHTSPAQPQQKYLKWTYNDLHTLSHALARRLELWGVKKGMAVLFVARNCAEWTLVFWACVRVGAVFVGVDEGVLGKGGDVRGRGDGDENEVGNREGNRDVWEYILGVVGPAVVVLQGRWMRDVVEMWGEDGGGLEQVGLGIMLEDVDERKGAGDIIETEDSNKLSNIPWINLSQLWEASPTPTPSQKAPKIFQNTVLINFTSGTTSLPKACPLSRSNLRQTCAAARSAGFSPMIRGLQLTPLHHAMASLYSIASISAGATIIYPSATFNVEAAIQAIEREKANSMAIVPSLLNAFEKAPGVRERDFGSLKAVHLAGSMVSLDAVRRVRDVFGKGIMVGVSWGMTESPAPVSRILLPGDDIAEDGFLAVGRPAKGVRVKICRPGERVPLEKGEEGELHAGGSQIISGYLEAENDCFYEDEDGRWIETGDLARIDEEGNVRILGRYKDIIIRGGANIAPASIEQHLNEVSGIEVHVIGIPDEMAGEVPLAIFRLLPEANEHPDSIIAKMQEVSMRKLGPKLAPVMYLNLQQDLGMEMLPMTSSGKVKKTVLRTKALRVLKRRENINISSSDSKSTREILTYLWSQVSGAPSETLGQVDDILKFVDSITIMRFSGLVRKTLKKDISVPDVMQNPSIKSQATLLDARSIIVGNIIDKRSGPPKAQHMAHCRGDSEIADYTQQLSEPLLHRLNLSWDDDVEDVIPAPDTLYLYLRRRRPQTWNQRAIFIAHNTTHTEFIAAWKATLHSQPLLRSLAVKQEWSETQLLIIIRPIDSWWKASVLPDITVPTPDDLRQTYVDEWADADTGPLVRVAFARIESTPNDTGMVFLANHAVFDNMSGNLLFEDLITALKKKLTPESITPTLGHSSFKQYADQYYLKRERAGAKAAIKWHVDRLSGISSLKGALWPKQRAPGWFKGADQGWKNDDGSLGDPTLRTPLDPENDRFGLDGLTRTVHAPGLALLRERHNIKPYAVLKAAVALFNTHTTGYPTALFANLEAARYWPWISEDEQKALPNPLGIAGPMFEVVVNRIDTTNKSETVLNFLARIQDDQEQLSKNSHVPLFDLLAALPSDDAEVVREIMDRQIWNWPAIIQSHAQPAPSQIDNKERISFTKLTRAAYDDVGLAWTCGLWDKETFYLNASYDDCQLSKNDAFKALGEVLSAATWLVGNLENTLGEVVFEGDVGGLIPSLE